ncbi:MAG: NAD(P)/FAD-dependent oxidoreductase [Bacteroidota bacterium]
MKSKRKHLMILGGGFATLPMIKIFEKAFAGDESLKISIISRENFFLFTPMLPEVASGSIETRHIVHPIRQLCRKIHFYQSVVESIDLRERTVTASHPSGPHRHTWHFDYLVIAVGSVTNFFNLPGLHEHALTLKSLGDAIHIRNYVIDKMEQAEIEQDPQLRAELLTFVVSGGGFAGVELAGELNDFLREASRHYASIRPSDIHIYLIEALPRILPEVSEELGRFATENLKKRGILIITGVQVNGATGHAVQLKDGREIRTRTLIWTAGVSTNPLVAQLECRKDELGRIKVNEYLEVTGCSNAWAVGDCASVINASTGNPFPPTAQHAVREGKVTAKNIVAAIRAVPMEPFEYKMRGQLAMLGRRAGVGIILGVPVQGFLAWWLWRSYYLLRLPTFQKKLRVITDWTIELFFPRDITQIKVSRGVIVSEKESV